MAEACDLARPDTEMPVFVAEDRRRGAPRPERFPLKNRVDGHPDQGAVGSPCHSERSEESLFFVFLTLLLWKKTQTLKAWPWPG